MAAELSIRISTNTGTGNAGTGRQRGQVLQSNICRLTHVGNFVMQDLTPNTCDPEPVTLHPPVAVDPEKRLKIRWKAGR